MVDSHQRITYQAHRPAYNHFVHSIRPGAHRRAYIRGRTRIDVAHTRFHGRKAVLDLRGRNAGVS